MFDKMTFMGFLFYIWRIRGYMEQKMIKAAYAGVPGAYAEAAAKLIYDGCDAVPYADFAAAYEAAASGVCDCAVLPLENSYAGDVAQVVDLAFTGALNIAGLYDMEISHCLLGIKGSKLSDISDVYSHPQALWQSVGFVKKHGLAAHEMSNTAVAAEAVAKQGLKSAGVIASRHAAELYSLDVLAENVNESGKNTTRFAVFSKEMPKGSKHFIMFFTVKNEAGSLAKAVNIISDYGYNMRALKSRPTKINNWEYYFYVEGDGSLKSAAGREMLEKLGQYCLNIKVAGTYDREIQL